MHFTRSDALIHAWYGDGFAAELEQGRLLQGELVYPLAKPGPRARDGRRHYWHRWLVQGALPGPFWKQMPFHTPRYAFEFLHSPNDVSFAVPLFRVAACELAFIIPLFDAPSRSMYEDLERDPLELALSARELPIEHHVKLDYRAELESLPPHWRTPRTPEPHVDRRVEFAGALSQFLRDNGRSKPDGVETTFAMLVLHPRSVQRLLWGGPAADVS